MRHLFFAIFIFALFFLANRCTTPEPDDELVPLGCYDYKQQTDDLTNFFLRGLPFPAIYRDRVVSCKDRCLQAYYNESHELVLVLVESCRDGVRTPSELWVK